MLSTGVLLTHYWYWQATVEGSTINTCYICFKCTMTLWLMLRSIFFYWMIDSLVYLAFSNYFINPWSLGLFQIVVSSSFLSMTWVREREFAQERDSIYLQVCVHTQQSQRAIMLAINVHVTDLWDMLWLFILNSACFNAINQQEKMKRGDNAFLLLTTVCSV